MSRTRGVSQNLYDGGGVLTGKGGEPIPVSPFVSKANAITPSFDKQGNPVSPAATVAYQNAPRRIHGATVFHGPGAEPVPVQPRIVGYRAEPKTWSKNMEAYELARLIHMLLRAPPAKMGDGLIVDVSVEEWNHLDGDLRRHFMPVREV